MTKPPPLEVGTMSIQDRIRAMNLETNLSRNSRNGGTGVDAVRWKKAGPLGKAEAGAKRALPDFAPTAVPAPAFATPVLRKTFERAPQKLGSLAVLAAESGVGEGGGGSTSEPSEAAASLAPISAPARTPSKAEEGHETHHSPTPKKISIADIWRKREQAALLNMNIAESPRAAFLVNSRSSMSLSTSALTSSPHVHVNVQKPPCFDEKKEDSVSDHGIGIKQVFPGPERMRNLIGFKANVLSDRFRPIGSPSLSFESTSCAMPKAFPIAPDNFASSVVASTMLPSSKAHSLPSRSPTAPEPSTLDSHPSSPTTLKPSSHFIAFQLATDTEAVPPGRPRVSDRWIKRDEYFSSRKIENEHEEDTSQLKMKIPTHLGAQTTNVTLNKGKESNGKLYPAINEADKPRSCAQELKVEANVTSPASGEFCSSSTPVRMVEVDNVSSGLISETKTIQSTRSTKIRERWLTNRPKSATHPGSGAENRSAKSPLGKQVDDENKDDNDQGPSTDEEGSLREGAPLKDTSSCDTENVTKKIQPTESIGKDESKADDLSSSRQINDDDDGTDQKRILEITDVSPRDIVLRRWSRRAPALVPTPQEKPKNEAVMNEPPKSHLSSPDRRMLRNRASVAGEIRAQWANKGGASRFRLGVYRTVLTNKGNTEPEPNGSRTTIDRQPVSSKEQIQVGGHPGSSGCNSEGSQILTTSKTKSNSRRLGNSTAIGLDLSAQPKVALEVDEFVDEKDHCSDEEKLDQRVYSIISSASLLRPTTGPGKTGDLTIESEDFSQPLDIIGSVSKWKKTQPNDSARHLKVRKSSPDVHTSTNKSPPRTRPLPDVSQGTPERKKSLWLRMGQAHASRVHFVNPIDLDERSDEPKTKGWADQSSEGGEKVKKQIHDESGSIGSMPQSISERYRRVSSPIIPPKRIVAKLNARKNIEGENQTMTPVVARNDEDVIREEKLSTNMARLPSSSQESGESTIDLPLTSNLIPPRLVQSPESVRDEFSVDSGVLSQAFIDSVPEDEMHQLSISVSIDTNISQTIDALVKSSQSARDSPKKFTSAPASSTKAFEPPSEYASFWVPDSDSVMFSQKDAQGPLIPEPIHLRQASQERDLATFPSGEGSAFSGLSISAPTVQSNASAFSARASKVMREKKQRRLPSYDERQDELVFVSSSVDVKMPAHDFQECDMLNESMHQAELEYDTSVSITTSHRRDTSFSPDASTYSSNTLMQTFDSTLTPTTRSDTARRNFSFGSDTTGASSNYYSVDASENESNHGRRQKKRGDRERKSRGSRRDRSMKDMIADQFVSASNDNVEAFKSAYQSLSLGQIAHDLKEEAGTVLNLNRIATDINQGMSAASESLNKLVGSEIFTAGLVPFPSPRERDGSVEEDVAIEVEYIESDNEESDLEITRALAQGSDRRCAV